MVPLPWLIIPIGVLTLLLLVAFLVLFRGRGQDRLVETLAAGFQKTLG